MKAGLFFTALGMMTILGCSTVQAVKPVGASDTSDSAFKRFPREAPARRYNTEAQSAKLDNYLQLHKAQNSPERFPGNAPARRYTEAQAAELQKSILQPSRAHRNPPNQPLSRSSSSSSLSSSSSYKTARGSERSTDNSGPLPQASARQLSRSSSSSSSSSYESAIGSERSTESDNSGPLPQAPVAKPNWRAITKKHMEDRKAEIQKNHLLQPSQAQKNTQNSPQNPLLRSSSPYFKPAIGTFD